MSDDLTMEASTARADKAGVAGVVLPAAFVLLTRCNAWLSLMFMRLAVIGLILIAAAVFGQVFGRYVLNNSPTWTEEFALVLVLYVTNIGMAVCVRDDRHMGVEVLLIKLQPDFQRRVKIFIHLMVIAFAVLMLWNGFVLADQIVHYMIPNLGISQGFTYYPLILSGVLIILFSIEHICALIFHTKVVPSWH